jgi:hypothetical protein
MADASLDCEMFCANVRAHVMAWPAGEIRPMADHESRRSWATVVRLGDKHLLIWISAHQPGVATAQIMVFNFRKLGKAVFAGFEEGPESKACVVPTVTLSIEGHGWINDSLAVQCLSRAGHAIHAWEPDMSFNTYWEGAQDAARQVMQFFAPAQFCVPVQLSTRPDAQQHKRQGQRGRRGENLGGGMKSPDGGAF